MEKPFCRSSGICEYETLCRWPPSSSDSPQYTVCRPGLDAHRHGAGVEVGEHERVEDLARRAGVEALGVGRVIVVVVAREPAAVGQRLAQRRERPDRRQVGHDQRRIAARVVAVVGVVVPAGGADAEAEHPLVDDVELGQEIQPVLHDVALVEAVRALVGE